ncbi:hypothetical protein ACFX2J_043540 [Malus domestica]
MAPSPKSKALLCNTVKSPPLLRKQEYFISCFLHVFFFVLVLTCGTRRKKVTSQHLVSIFRSGTDCLEPFPDYLPSTAIEIPIISTSYASREDTTSARRTDKARENDTLKHVETSTTKHVPNHPLLLQNQKYLISSGLQSLWVEDLF